MAKAKPRFKHLMRDGSVELVEGTRLNDLFHYHSQDGLYWLTHTPSGRFITSSKKVKSIRELINEPEFFEEITVTNLYRAYQRWINRNSYKV